MIDNPARLMICFYMTFQESRDRLGSPTLLRLKKGGVVVFRQKNLFFLAVHNTPLRRLRPGT